MAAALDSKSSVRIGRGGSTPPLGTRSIITVSARYSKTCMHKILAQSSHSIARFRRPAPSWQSNIAAPNDAFRHALARHAGARIFHQLVA